MTDNILKDATEVMKNVGLEADITLMPRIIDKQHQRSKHTAESPSKYWRSLRIPYLHSIFTFHKERFSEDNSPSLSLSQLHRRISNDVNRTS